MIFIDWCTNRTEIYGIAIAIWSDGNDRSICNQKQMKSFFFSILTILFRELVHQSDRMQFTIYIFRIDFVYFFIVA